MPGKENDRVKGKESTKEIGVDEKSMKTNRVYSVFGCRMGIDSHMGRFVQQQIIRER